MCYNQEKLMKAYCFLLMMLTICYLGFIETKMPAIRYLCPQKRPTFCNKMYVPTCGFTENQMKNSKNYGNPCDACSHAEVKYIMCGECPKQSPVPSMCRTKAIANANDYPTCMP